MADAGTAVDTLESQTEGSESNINEVLAVTQETVTYAVYRAKDAKDKASLGFGILKDGNDLHKSIYGYKDAKGNEVAPDTDLLRTATVTEPVVHSAEGITQVVSDSDEAASIFMQGVRQKLKSQLKSKLTATNDAGDFEFPDDNVTYEEVVEILSTPLQRRNQTETQKAMKAVKSFSPEVMKAVLAQMGYVA